MAFRRPAPRATENLGARPTPESAPRVVPPPPAASAAAPAALEAQRDWSGDESGFLAEVLRGHGLTPALVERLSELATAPVHTQRLVDRLAVAVAAHFHFLPLEEALAAPILLYGKAGAGVSTLAAKLAARFDEREVLVISTEGHGADTTAQLAENLDVLGLPLAFAADASALRSIVAGANGRKVVIDAGAGALSDSAAAGRIQKLVEASGAQGTLVLSAHAETDDAIAIARTAARIGTQRLIVTQFDTARHIGSTLAAAEAGKLALVAASVTPHFAFGIRSLSPENVARRLMAAAPRSERWRSVPL